MINKLNKELSDIEVDENGMMTFPKKGTNINFFTDEGGKKFIEIDGLCNYIEREYSFHSAEINKITKYVVKQLKRI